MCPVNLSHEVQHNASLTFQNACGEPESLLIVYTNDIEATGYRIIRDAALPVARTEMSLASRFT